VDAGHEDEGVSRNYDGQTALHLAASSISKEKSEEMVHFLASRWPNSVEWRDKTGKTAVSITSPNTCSLLSTSIIQDVQDTFDLTHTL